ncbi:TonB-dependent receptor [Aquimarina sp. AD10]|uniref:TonB-dependent receptor domain-containing protein n=1 Tax=Aquimarina sp. AD10 TaxID=1714849 RepID=UPI000E4AED08|nr:TonB-dependent receptor [Aquimarina sp. AD10]AXT59338.1 TonB-dependent receptor [Aquimarina sp. AD10]RKM95156.1 TonB-dependent receptor [Aquimarina sp. AD10]
MKKFLFVLPLFVLYTIQAQQRNFPTGPINIKGIILDQDTNTPLEYATLSFFNPRLQKVVTGGITDGNGLFNIEIDAGVYDISIEYISFETKKISKQKLFKNTDLGTITLALDRESLDDVVIIAEKTTVEVRLDKKIYNVGKDLTVSGGTVSDVLDNVPSVSVDVEGNVALRGNDNVRILINGKPSGLVGLNSTDALRQLPAESIERVEVITSPSARYDAEGTAGILNIILRRSKLQGLNGAITINSGYPLRAGISGNINYRTGDFNFFTTSGYNYREIPGNSLSETRFLNIDDNGLDNPDTFLNEKRDFDRIRKGLNTNFGVEWYINDSSSLTTSFLFRSSDNESNTTNIISEPDANGTILSQNIRFDPEIEDDVTKQFSLNYTKNFNTSGHKLTFDFQKEKSNEEEDSRITQDNQSAIELVNTNEDQDRILLQADYVLPLKKKSQFELGYRGNFNTLDTDYLVQIEDNGIITTDTDLSNTLLYKEYVNAVYSQYGSKTGKLSYLLGLRIESTRITIDQQTTNDLSKKNYTDVFPTVNLGLEISEKQSITLGYNRRIRRPRSRFINPFPSRSSATNLFQGNPDLDPSYANTFDLGYLHKFGKLTLNSSVYYNRSTQVFNFISEDTGDTATIGVDENDVPVIVPVIRRTPINLTSADRYGFEFTLIYNPSRKWRINGNFNAFQNNVRGENNGESLDADNFSWFARLNNKITLPAKIDWQTSIFYRGPNENAQTKSDGIFSTTLAFSKDLFKEKASVTFNVNDVFNSRKRMSTATTSTFISDSEFQWRERSFNLSFTYRFNQKKKKKRPQRDLNGQDDFEG